MCQYLGQKDEHARWDVRVAPRRVLVSWPPTQSLVCDFLSSKRADLIGRSCIKKDKG